MIPRTSMVSVPRWQWSWYINATYAQWSIITYTNHKLNFHKHNHSHLSPQHNLKLSLPSKLSVSHLAYHFHKYTIQWHSKNLPHCGHAPRVLVSSLTLPSHCTAPLTWWWQVSNCNVMRQCKCNANKEWKDRRKQFTILWARFHFRFWSEHRYETILNKTVQNGPSIILTIPWH